MTDKKLTLPIVHLNGTSRDRLQEQVNTAIRKLREAENALSEASPNARDYYPLGDGAFSEAMREHGDRMRRLRSVQDELQAIFDHLWERP